MKTVGILLVLILSDSSQTEELANEYLDPQYVGGEHKLEVFLVTPVGTWILRRLLFLAASNTYIRLWRLLPNS